MFSMLHAEKREGLVDFADVMDVVWDDAGRRAMECALLHHHPRVWYGVALAVPAPVKHLVR